MRMKTVAFAEQLNSLPRRRAVPALFLKRYQTGPSDASFQLLSSSDNMSQ
jgi:hypothetical protein